MSSSSNIRFPAEATASAEAFLESSWRGVLQPEDALPYASIWSRLSQLARDLSDAGERDQAKSVWLVADACSTMLNSGSLNEPFQPVMVAVGRRSALPEDFDESALAFFGELLPALDDDWIRARLADVLWLRTMPRNPNFALAAIDAYRAIPPGSHDARRGWSRALALARSLGAGAGTRLSEMADALLDTFTRIDDDEVAVLGIARLLLEHGLHVANAAQVATKLRATAVRRAENGRPDSARGFYLLEGDWLRRAQDPAGIAAATAAAAETWVAEAMANRASGSGSHMVAASFLENAIQLYRTIPRSERPAHRVAERIAELHDLMRDSGKRSLDEMRSFESPPIDLTQMIEAARSAVDQDDTLAALSGFADVAPLTNVADLRQLSEKVLREHPLQALISATHMSRDGRVIAKTAGLGDRGEDYDRTVQAEMIKTYSMMLGVSVQGSILPALELLLLRHRLRQEDLIAIAQQAPIVPPGRGVLFGKALFCGFEGDFASAIHLLVPQIEHLVRYHLKAAGVRTTNISQDGVENENGMSALVVLPETEEIFGETLTFELTALFCDALGPNLRNEVAHGLLDDQTSRSPSVVYAWWLGLKIAFKTFWNARARNQSEPTVAGDEEVGAVDAEKPVGNNSESE